MEPSPKITPRTSNPVNRVKPENGCLMVTSTATYPSGNDEEESIETEMRLVGEDGGCRNFVVLTAKSKPRTGTISASSVAGSSSTSQTPHKIPLLKLPEFDGRVVSVSIETGFPPPPQPSMIVSNSITAVMSV